jgi:hypothetical protein
MRRFSLVSVVAVALSLSAAVSPASASVTIGQIATPDGFCNPVPASDYAQPSVTSGNSYVVKGAGTITSWSHIAAAGMGQQMKMKVFRPIGGLTYTVVGQDGPQPLTESAPNTFPTSIAVRAGDVLGLTTVTGSAAIGCAFGVPGQTYYRAEGDHANGAPVTFSIGPGDCRLNISAVLNPTNSFILGDVDRNKKKGTASLTVNVPSPGQLALSGTGLKPVSAVATAAGDVKLTIKAKGKKKRKLNETGKVKVTPTITYTPTGGSPSTQSRKLKLKKRR